MIGSVGLPAGGRRRPSPPPPVQSSGKRSACLVQSPQPPPRPARARRCGTKFNRVRAGREGDTFPTARHAHARPALSPVPTRPGRPHRCAPGHARSDAGATGSIKDVRPSDPLDGAHGSDQPAAWPHRWKRLHGGAGHFHVYHLAFGRNTTSAVFGKTSRKKTNARIKY